MTFDVARTPGSSMPRLPRQNNFDLLRLLFATTVFLYHGFALTNNPHLSVLGAYTDPALAVQGFFVISGFLIVMSYEQSSGLGQYIGKRLRRIYPAYSVVIIVAALLGVLISSVPASRYFGYGLIKYLTANLGFMNWLHPELPGVFATNRLNAVNGSLWTIKVEVMFYLFVPVLVAWRWRFNPAVVMTAIYVASIVYYEWFSSRGEVHAAVRLPGQLSFFVSGALIYYYFDFFRSHAWKLALLAILGLVIAGIFGWYVFYPMSVAIMVAYLGACIRYLGNFARYGDLSHRVYIVHFPVLQTLIAMGYFARAPYPALAAAAVIVALLPLLSWHFVEKRFLYRTSHYAHSETERKKA